MILGNGVVVMGLICMVSVVNMAAIDAPRDFIGVITCVDVDREFEWYKKAESSRGRAAC